LIGGPSPLALATLACMREDFEESSLPFAVDLIDWATASEGFRRVIDDQAVVLRPARG